MTVKLGADRVPGRRRGWRRRSGRGDQQHKEGADHQSRQRQHPCPLRPATGTLPPSGLFPGSASFPQVQFAASGQKAQEGFVLCSGQQWHQQLRARGKGADGGSASGNGPGVTSAAPAGSLRSSSRNLGPAAGEKEEGKKVRQQWESWSTEDKTTFFKGLYEHGKDFEAIQNNIALKYKKKGKPASMVKNKEQVRHFYYRMWHKITKFIDFDSSEWGRAQITRKFRLNSEGKLEQTVSMATTTQPLTQHLHVTYRKVTP
ncbi:uncharacterized protein LOC143675678 [Tamandua tetradactyla]|uniref:uncharacterized protein LOC143675678 n=1 Tax=Tamandua tetradactyla TaxID=48850 RepID=UPI00405475E3